MIISDMPVLIRRVLIEEEEKASAFVPRTRKWIDLSQRNASHCYQVNRFWLSVKKKQIQILNYNFTQFDDFWQSWILLKKFSPFSFVSGWCAEMIIFRKLVQFIDFFKAVGKASEKNEFNFFSKLCAFLCHSFTYYIAASISFSNVFRKSFHSCQLCLIAGTNLFQ